MFAKRSAAGFHYPGSLMDFAFFRYSFPHRISMYF
jgi:hypothetical protein